MSAPRIEHDAGASRFVAHLDAGDAYLAYRQSDANTLDLQHTLVPEAARGDGVGEALVQAALDHARARHQRIIPSCPFVASWIEQHPEAADLVAR